MKITSIANPAATAPKAAETRVIKMQTQRTPSSSVEGFSSETPVTPIKPVAALSSATEGLKDPTEQKAPEATEQLSPQYVALARREKQLRKLQSDLNAERDAFKAQQQGYVSLDSLKADPLKALTEAGISYEQLTGATTADQVDPIQAKIDALEAKITGFDKNQADKAKQDYDQAISVIANDVKLLVSADPAYETIKATNSETEVVKLIEKVFQSEGTILSVEEAAQLVEDKLLDRTVNQVRQLSQLKKIQSRLSPPASTEEKPLPGKSQTRTLTNAMGVTRQLTARERAILAFNNQLK